MRTKSGGKMNVKTRDALIDVLSNPEHEGKKQKEIAELLKLNVRTVQNYLTANVWQEIHNRRLEVIDRSLNLVDRAVFAKAIKGDMVAAKILYKRWDEIKEQEEIKEIHNLEEEDLEEIKRLESNIQELENDKDKHA